MTLFKIIVLIMSLFLWPDRKSSRTRPQETSEAPPMDPDVVQVAVSSIRQVEAQIIKLNLNWTLADWKLKISNLSHLKCNIANIIELNHCSLLRAVNSTRDYVHQNYSSSLISTGTTN